MELPIKQCLGAVSTVKPDFVQDLAVDKHIQIRMRRSGGPPEAHHMDSISPGGSSAKNKISTIAWVQCHYLSGCFLLVFIGLADVFTRTRPQGIAMRQMRWYRGLTNLNRMTIPWVTGRVMANNSLRLRETFHL